MRNKKTVNHFKAGECNDSSWGCPKKVGSTPAVKTTDTILLKYFLNAVNHTRITLFRMMALLLKPRAYYLQMPSELILSLFDLTIEARQTATNLVTMQIFFFLSVCCYHAIQYNISTQK